MKKKQSFTKKLMQHKATPLFLILVIMMLITMVFTSGVLKGAPIKDMFTRGFMSKTNWRSNFFNLVIQIMMMIGLSCILMSGNIDLSIGAQGALGAFLFGRVCSIASLPVWVCFLSVFVIAGIFGAINIFLVNKLHFPAFIATIGASSIYSGLSTLLSNGYNTQITRPEVLWVGSAVIGDLVPLTFIFALVMLVVFEYILFKTKFGRSIYMCGGNPSAARLAGLNANKTRAIMFLINSFFAVLGGVFWSAQVGLASPTAIVIQAPNMTATAAAILGGVAFSGGSGELVGPLIAVIVINVLQNMLDFLHVGSYYTVLAQGVLLLLALILDYSSDKRRKNAMIKAAISQRS